MLSPPKRIAVITHEPLGIEQAPKPKGDHTQQPRLSDGVRASHVHERVISPRLLRRRHSARCQVWTSGRWS